MKKRYFISLWTKRGRLYRVSTNSIKLSNFIMKLNIWKIVKLTDRETNEVIAYKNSDKDRVV